MNELEEICEWLREYKGITKISMEKLVEYVPEFEDWKEKLKLKRM